MRGALPYGIVFAMALAVRLIHHAYMQAGYPLYGYLLRGGDNFEYHRWALEIANAWPLDRVPFAQAPLYPYLLGLVYLRFGDDFTTAVVVQHVLGACTAVMTMVIARRAFDAGTAIVSGVAAALCPAFLLYEGELLADWLVVFTAMAMLLVLMMAGERRSLAWWAAAGVCLGLSVLARPNMLLFAPVAAAWAWCNARGDRRLVSVAAVTAAAVITVLPATLANTIAGGQFALVSTNGPVNLYIGNAPDATGVFARPESMLEIERESGESGGEPDWIRELLGGLRENPAALPRNLATKTALLLRTGEVPHIINVYLVREFSPFLRTPLWWGTVAPLGIVGLALVAVDPERRRFGSNASLLGWFVIAVSISLVVVFILARYRLPILGALIPFAAWSVVRFTGHVRAVVLAGLDRAPIPRADRRAALSIAAGWLVLLVVLHTPEPERLIRWNDHYNLAGAYEARNMKEEALAHYERALELAPELEPVIAADLARTREIPDGAPVRRP